MHPGDHDPARRLRDGADVPARPARDDGAQARWRPRAARSTYQFGTMIELPRAALTAGEIAKTAEFFSFGTNDLTQTTLGCQPRRRRGQVPRASTWRWASSSDNPFETIDQVGVGALMKQAIAAGPRRRARTSSSASAASTAASRTRVEFFHQHRPRLRELLALPRADRAPRRRAGRARRRRGARPLPGAGVGAHGCAPLRQPR